ncbi:MAG: AMIN domain-containing protein, partial [Oceanisphaera sp.]|nr:AMIN domain-containing protein [Oceanisphaera sp.]
MTKRIMIRLVCSLALSLVPLDQLLAAVSLESLRVNPLAGNQLMLELEFDASLSLVTDVVRQHPDRLVLQIPDGFSALPENRIPIERQGISAVDVRRVGNQLEVVLLMDTMQPYRLQREGRRLSLLLGEGVSG